LHARLRVPRNKDNGFTLTELLIVIVILGILAGIVVFAVVNFTNTGAEAACKADKRTLELASEAYRAQKGGYPGSVAPDTVAAANNDTNSDLRIAILKNTGYVREVPSETNYVLWLNNDGSVTKNSGPSGC
jgi:general secretion pathway protein G